MGISTKPPSGMRDFLSEELVRRRFVIDTIKNVYEKYGFLPLETPSIENLSTLLGKYGAEGDQLLFKILHRRDKLTSALENPNASEKDLGDLGLRYDLTVPLARVVANNSNLPKFFKRYQIQPVWRADRPGRGRFREFLQCDVDITGSKSLIAEAEVCSAVSEVLLALGLTNFRIHLNHRQLLRCLVKAAGISTDKESATLVAVDKLDKVGLEGLKKELEQRGIDAEQTQKLMALILRPEGLSESEEISRLAALLEKDEKALEAIKELKELAELLDCSKAAGQYCFDVSLARGLGYYTGSIFEIRSSDFSGSLGGGGRYDGLIGMFKGSEIPAVGFSIGFERLILILEEKGFFKDLINGVDILICHFPDVANSVVIEAANALRDGGIKVEVYPETPKLGKQISYAESIKAPYVAIIGASESEKKQLSLKNLITGEQLTLSYSEAAQKIRQFKR